MSSVVWSDPEWLQFFPLNAFTALDYFARSSFYDASCNNEKLRELGQDLTKLPTLPPGVEYVIHDTQEPHLYIIRKQHRSSPSAVVPVSFYYILDGRVFQAPTIHAVLTSRLSRCLFNVRTAFERIQQDIDPLQRIGQEEAQIAQDSKLPALSSDASTQRRTRPEERERTGRIDAILHSVVTMHAALLPEDVVQPQQQRARADAQGQD